MRIARRLPQLGYAATKRIQSLSNIIGTIRPDTPIPVQESIVARVTIDFHNTWTNFCRAFYLSCLLRARKADGSVVTVPAPAINIDDALGRAVLHFRPRATPKSDGSWHRRDEPTWHDVNNLLAIFQAQGVSNISDIQAALSAGYRVFLDLPVFRNYFGHRNQQSIEAARNAGVQNAVPPLDRPSEMLLTRSLGRQQPLLLDWFDDVKFTIHYLCV